MSPMPLPPPRSLSNGRAAGEAVRQTAARSVSDDLGTLAGQSHMPLQRAQARGRCPRHAQAPLPLLLQQRPRVRTADGSGRGACRSAGRAEPIGAAFWPLLRRCVGPGRGWPCGCTQAARTPQRAHGAHLEIAHATTCCRAWPGCRASVALPSYPARARALARPSGASAVIATRLSARSVGLADCAARLKWFVCTLWYVLLNKSVY